MTDPFARYSRQIFMEEIAVEGQRKIMQSKVLVVGAGGLGSAIIPYLAAAGIGTLGIIDHDVVELHNLNRQIIHQENHVGWTKVSSALKYVQALNNSIQVIPMAERLTADNIEATLKDFDIIVDGSDNFKTRYLVNDYCVQMDKVLVYGSTQGFEGQLSVFNFQGSKNLRDLFPEPTKPEELPTCDSLGVLGPLAGIIGNMMALQVIKIAADLPVDSNQLTIIDSYNWKLMKVEF